MIIFNSASSSGYEASLSTYNWSHTVNGKDRLLVVGVAILIAGSVTSITYNGINLTKIRSDAGATYRSELWYLLNPSVGVGTIEVILSASLTSIAGAASYTGVSKIGPIGAHTGATGTNNPATVNLTTTVDNALVIDTAAIQTTSVSVGAGNTERWNNNGALGSGVGGDKAVASPASSTMSWTGLGALDAWAISAVEIRPQAADAVFEINNPDTAFRYADRMVGY